MYPTRQAMHLKRNTETRSRNYCCSGKAINVTYSECVFLWPVGCTFFFHIIS